MNSQDRSYKSNNEKYTGMEINMNNNVNWDKLDNDMQRGYSYAKKQDSVSACNEWKDVWNTIISIMDENNYNTIEALDKDFNGLQFISNWVSDFEMELDNASSVDVSFAQIRIDFCTELLNRVSDQNELNSLNMRRAIAESYYAMGRAEDGDREFVKLTDEHPTWGWGWIGWSDQYCDYSKNENTNHDRTVEILTKALEIAGIDEKAEIRNRLEEEYEAYGKYEEAKSIPK